MRARAGQAGARCGRACGRAQCRDDARCPGYRAKCFAKISRVRKPSSFTGSTQVGKLLYRQCADTVKKLTLELGGIAC